MTSDTRSPELEQAFIAAGCGHSVAVHVASSTEAFEEHDLGKLAFPVGADPARRKEFSAGRMLAQRGFLSLGQPPALIAYGSDREPLWPEGVVGSIAHTGEFAAAVIWASSIAQKTAGIGIDAEQCSRLDPKLWPTVFTPAEIVSLEQEPSLSQNLMATYMFSAKEAVYKAQFPLTRRFIEFDEVTVRMQSSNKADESIGWLRLDHDIRELDRFHFSVFYYCLGSIVITGAVALTKSNSLQNGT